MRVPPTCLNVGCARTCGKMISTCVVNMGATITKAQRANDNSGTTDKIMALFFALFFFELLLISFVLALFGQHPCKQKKIKIKKAQAKQKNSFLQKEFPISLTCKSSAQTGKTRKKQRACAKKMVKLSRERDFDCVHFAAPSQALSQTHII